MSIHHTLLHGAPLAVSLILYSIPSLSLAGDRLSLSDFRLERLSARLEGECGVPVTVENRGGVPEGITDVPGGCSPPEIAQRAQAALGDACAYGAWVVDHHVHIGPALPLAGGGCRPALTALDQPSPLGPGKRDRTDMPWHEVGVQPMDFSGGPHTYYEVPDHPITWRELLDQPVERERRDGRHLTWKIIVQPTHTFLSSTFAGGPYRSWYDQEGGPYHHTTRWWTDEPGPRALTPDEKAIALEKHRAWSRGEITDAEWREFTLELARATEPVQPEPEPIVVVE